MRTNWRSIAISAAVVLALGAVAAWAAQTNYLGTVFIADPTTPTRQLQVNSDGSINAAVTGGSVGITQLTGDVTAGPGSNSQAATLVTAQPGAHAWAGAQTFVQTKQTAAALTGCNGSTATMNLAVASYFSCTVSTGAVTLAASNPAATGLVSEFMVELTNGGSQTVNWMAGTKWPGGVAPTLTTAGIDVISCVTRDGATTWRCYEQMADSK